MKIIATNIGKRKEINWKGKKVVTGIFKFPVDAPIFLDRENVKEDTICDRRHHGGIDQAVYGYSEKHYEYWKKIHATLDWQFGMFGENLTIDDLDESKIHQGDRFKIGDVILEATKPREPCMKLGIRFSNMNIVKQFWNTKMSGVYFKVLQTGFVKSGDDCIQTKICSKNPTIADLYAAKKARININN